MTNPSINSRFAITAITSAGNSSSDEVESPTLPTVSIEGLADRRNEPVDRYRLHYLVFYFLGMTTLLPWNFFVTAEDVSTLSCRR